MSHEQNLVAMSSYNADGSSTRVRLYDWLDHLSIDATRYGYAETRNNQLGTLLRALPSVISAEVSLRRLPRALGDSTLLLSRAASPFSSGKIEESLLRAAARSVYDFDDALYVPSNLWQNRLWDRSKVWRRSVATADVVIAGSEVLADAATAHSNRVVMIPSCVSPAHYVRRTDYAIGEVPRAVWIGSPATERFLADLAEPLLALNARYGLRVTVISGGDASLGAIDPIVDRRAWHRDTFARHISEGDLGLMPLPDTPFTRGKCAYKLLQYGATALPVVGTPVGANEGAIAKLGGLAATTASEWFEAIDSILVAPEKERARRGDAALDGVWKHFSFDAWAAEWRKAVGLDSRGEA